MRALPNSVELQQAPSCHAEEGVLLVPLEGAG